MTQENKTVVLPTVNQGMVIAHYDYYEGTKNSLPKVFENFQTKAIELTLDIRPFFDIEGKGDARIPKLKSEFEGKTFSISFENAKAFWKFDKKNEDVNDILDERITQYYEQNKVLTALALLDIAKSILHEGLKKEEHVKIYKQRYRSVGMNVEIVDSNGTTKEERKLEREMKKTKAMLNAQALIDRIKSRAQ